jgi:hypothetical protein
MNVRLVRILAILGVMFAACAASAQTSPPESTSKPSLLQLPTEREDSDPASHMHPSEATSSPLKPKSSTRFFKARFVTLSAAVYGAGLADMHQTLEVRHSAGWYEVDPLARPFARLPAPAYYASGLVLATGVNWLSWKMAHTRRWRKLSSIPQVLVIGGNLYGVHTNTY